MSLGKGHYGKWSLLGGAQPIEVVGGQVGEGQDCLGSMAGLHFPAYIAQETCGTLQARGIMGNRVQEGIEPQAIDSRGGWSKAWAVQLDYISQHVLHRKYHVMVPCSQEHDGK